MSKNIQFHGMAPLLLFVLIFQLQDAPGFELQISESTINTIPQLCATRLGHGCMLIQKHYIELFKRMFIKRFLLRFWGKTSYTQKPVQTYKNHERLRYIRVTLSNFFTVNADQLFFIFSISKLCFTIEKNQNV